MLYKCHKSIHKDKKKLKKYCVAMSRYIMFDLTTRKFECEKILKKSHDLNFK